MLKYKIDTINALKEVGFYPRRLRQEHLLAESTMTKLRRGQPISWENLDTLCRLLSCQPGDILAYAPDAPDA